MYWTRRPKLLAMIIIINYRRFQAGRGYATLIVYNMKLKCIQPCDDLLISKRNER